MKSQTTRAALKVAIVGNCQVRPLAEILSVHPRIRQDVTQIIVHLTNDDVAEQHDQLLAEADIILCQLVADNYPVKYVRTQNIQSRFPGKVVVWPNVFFHGQNPDLVYATGENNERIVGPIDAYHSRSLIELWQRSVNPRDIEPSNYVMGVFSPDQILQQVQQSFSDLAKRETNTDIKMSGFIENHWQSLKLFHTFNHPTAVTIKELAIKIFDYIGITDTAEIQEMQFNDWLGVIQPPTEQSMASLLDLHYPSETLTKGVELDEKLTSVVQGQYRSYDFSELVDCMFRCYDNQAHTMKNVRFTPALALPNRKAA